MNALPPATSDSVAASPARSETIGFIGLGAMGGPMARRLASLGYPVVVYDLDPRAIQSVVECGGRGADSVRAVGAQARLVFTCLPSLYALRKVLLGDDGVCAGGRVQALVDFSTTGSDFACEMALGLHARGVMLLDAPITGNVTTAGNGKLGIMCSGPRQAFEQAEPVMRDLASAIVLYLGEQTGKAQRLKLLNNLLSATGMSASCEMFVLGAKWGLDPQVMLDVINDGDSGSAPTRNKFPKSVLPRRFDYGARMAITAKDTSLTIKESEDLGVPMWIGQQVRQIWNYAASQGGAEKDGTALITFLEAWAGIEVRVGHAPPEETAANAPALRDGGGVVLVCQQGELAVIEQRLRQQGRACTLVGLETGSGPAGFLEALDAACRVDGSELAGRPVVNLCLMSTCDSGALAQTIAARAAVYVDAALTGTLRDVASGARAVLCGGGSAVFERVEPLLAALGTRVFHVSPKPGAAHLMQQINGALFATLFAVSCEAFVAGAKAGLEPLTMTRIMGVESGRNAASERIIPQQVATRTFDYGKRIGQACRELSLLSDEASRLGVTPWIMDKTRLLYALAAQLGGPDDDITRLVTHYEGWAGTKVETPA